MARPRLHDDALRARLLEVTSQVISSDGEGAVTVRKVASAAGTSASAVYGLFGSRDGLIGAVSAEGFQRFARHLADVPTTDDPQADLGRLGGAYRESALADPHFYRVMFHRGVLPTDEPAAPADRPTFRVLCDAVARVAPPASPPQAVERTALGLWALAHGLVSLELAGMLPGGAGEREQAYREALTTVGESLFAG